MSKYFVKCIEKYYNESENNGRYRSWEHCYLAFYNAITNGDKSSETKDYLSLQLAFYLASWGMYRGSSFLLQKDYTIHKKIVDLVLNEKYRELWRIQCEDLEKKIDILFELVDRINKDYSDIREDVKKENSENISDILITKVLLGTLGCVPAYDKFFKNGLRKSRMKNIGFTSKSINELCDYYKNNKEELEQVRSKMFIQEIEYPQMKLIDMGFWMIGKED